MSALPFSDDCEKGLLCSMILSPVVRNECVPFLPANVFYVPANQIVYDAIRSIGQQDGAIDFLLAKKWIIDCRQLEEIGGLEALSTFWDFVPSPANWRDYARVVKENWQRRNVILQAQGLVATMHDTHALFEESLSVHVEKTLTRLVLDVPRPEKTFRAHLLDAMDNMEERTRNRGIMGARFGIPALDSAIEGVRPGEYAVICAETSGGKSALALALVLNEAKRRNPVAMFSLEMSPGQIVERALALEGRISMKRIRAGTLHEHDYVRLAAASQALSELPIYLEEGYNMTIDQIVSRCRILKVKHDIGLAVIDYLQLLGSSKTENNREREIASISRKGRLMALELQLSVVVLSQLNDHGQLRESRAIGHDADTVLYIKDGTSDNVFERDLVLAKNRNGARGETIKLNFFAEYMRFEEIT